MEMISNQPPLGEAELDELAAFLDAEDADRMGFVACEGFFAALHSGPTLIPPSEWLPIVLGRASDQDGPFNSLAEASRIYSLLMRWYNETGAMLMRDEEDFAPHIAGPKGEPNGAAAVLWASGYAQAVALRYEDWRPLFEDRMAGMFDPFLTLLEIERRFESGGRFATAKAKKAAAELSDAILDVYAFWEATREVPETPFPEERKQPITRGSPKIGRNEPCTCRSGRKFKHCCGR